MLPAPPASFVPETILCDTSFVSIQQAGGVPSWPTAAVSRLNNAVLAINYVVLAELRAGHIYANWKGPRRTRAERFISAYLRVPLDMAIVDEWARLRATCKRAGVAVPDNDVWIAATATSRGWALVSCDAHFDLIPDVDHIKLPRRSDSSS